MCINCGKYTIKKYIINKGDEMTELQTAYYIVGIIFMGLMLLIGVVTVIAVLVIRAKINAIHQRIEDKLGQVANWAEKSVSVIDTIKKVTNKKTR